MEWDFKELVNLGVPMVILGAIGYALWKFGWYSVHRIFGDDTKGTKGLAGEWVDHELAWRVGLTERLEKQTSACEMHIETVKVMGDTLSQQMDAARLAKEAASLAAIAAAEGNKSLAHIDGVLTGRTEVLASTCEGVKKLQQVACAHCDMLCKLAEAEMPNSAELVNDHCKEIKRIIGEA
jgi:hypothetical protein